MQMGKSKLKWDSTSFCVIWSKMLFSLFKFCHSKWLKAFVSLQSSCKRKKKRGMAHLMGEKKWDQEILFYVSRRFSV